MSDSDSNFGGWGKRDVDRQMSSPYRPEGKRAHSNDSIDNEPRSKKSKTNDTLAVHQPPMLLFKHFLNKQEDEILIEEAMKKYNEYKETFACEQLQAFFDIHKDEEWFREKYHPDLIDETDKRKLESVAKRNEVYLKLKKLGWLDDIEAHINYQDNLIKLLDAVCIFLEGGDENDLKVLDRKMYRADSSEKTDIKINIKQDINTQLTSKNDFNDDEGVQSAEDAELEKPETNTVSILDDDFTESKAIDTNDQQNEPRPLHKTLSIFLKNVHQKVFRSQLEEIVKQFPGYLRIALQDPLPERKFIRRGWVTFADNTDVASVIWQLNKHRLCDTELGAVANNDDYQRIRPVDFLVSHRAVMRQDVKYAAKLVAKFDKRRGLWSQNDDNPLLQNITEYLVDEGNYEEEAYLGGNINNNLAITGGGDPNNVQIEEDRELASVLDRLLIYLRIVHSFDYYSSCEYIIEDDLPTKCGLMHVRGNPLSTTKRYTQAQLEEYMKLAEQRAQLVLDSIDKLDFQIASRLGVKEVDEAVDKFVTDNTREISKDKWLCPLSGKKFKGPEFVKKHIFNKFADRIENVKETLKYFNNYVLDTRRPQLPDHPSNRPPPLYNTNKETNHDDLENQHKPIIRRNDFSESFFQRNNRYGGSNDFNQRRSFGGGQQRRDNGWRNDNNNNGGGGRFYNNRNNSNSDFNSRSYHSRNILNYNDVNN